MTSLRPDETSTMDDISSNAVSRLQRRSFVLCKKIIAEKNNSKTALRNTLRNIIIAVPRRVSDFSLPGKLFVR